jgi:hypothetical protein
MAAFHHLRVTRDDGDAALPRRAGHAVRDALQIRDRKTFLDDETDGEMKRDGAGHRDVIDRAVDGERTDVAARKKQRGHNIPVRGHHHAACGQVERTLVVGAGERRIVERVDKNLPDQLGGGAAAGAMRHIHQAMARIDAPGAQPRHIHAGIFARAGPWPAARSRKRP